MHIRKHEFRFILVFITLIVLLLFFSIKLVLIQVFNADHLSDLAEKQHNHLIEIEPVRGGIYDRKNRPLAFNVSVYSLYANPRAMSDENKENAINELSVILKLDPEQLRTKLQRDKYFVWIERKLTMDLTDRIKALKIPGLGFRKETKRFYPNGHLSAHVIGFAGIDNTGLEGLELKYNDLLQGAPGRMHIIRDAHSRELMIEENVILPKDGLDLVLTIDETIQYITERALDAAFVKYKAKSATAIVMNVKTGEILALANRPTYDLGDVGKSSIESRTNRAISFVYEPGSVFKVVAAGAALEEETYTEKDIIFCENGKYRIANHTLHDHKPHGDLTFSEVFKYSSNIGVAKIVQKMGADKFYKHARRYPFGKKTGIDLKGEVSGVLKPPSIWSRTTIGAIPIGHEVTTTPLQLVTAIAAIANDGVVMRPYVVKQIRDQKGETIDRFFPEAVERVMTEHTAKRVHKILASVVEGGTGRRAKMDNITVAGKTGTAQKVIDGKYSHSHFVASFFGFAPVENPQLAAVVVVDDPRPIYYGGTVAAPVFKDIIENSIRYLESAKE